MTAEILSVSAQTIAAVSIFAAVVAGLAYLRKSEKDSAIKRAVHAVEQQYGQLDGPERLARAQSLVLNQYPRINQEYMNAGIEAAVLILGLTIEAVEAGQIGLETTPPAPEN